MNGARPRHADKPAYTDRVKFPRKETGLNFSELRPLQIIDVKMSDLGRELSVDAFIAAPIVKFYIGFASLLKPSEDKIKTWIADLTVLGPARFELLRKFRTNIIEISKVQQMKEYAESRLRILDQYLRDTSAESLAEKHHTGSVESPAIPPAPLRPPPLYQQSSTIDRNPKSPLEGELPRPSDKKQLAPEPAYEDPQKARSNAKPRGRKKIKHGTNGNDQLFKENDLGQRKARSRKTTSLVPGKTAKLENDHANELSAAKKEEDRPQHKLAQTDLEFPHADNGLRSMEAKVDFIVNIRLNELILDIKKRYFGAECVEAAKASEELESMHRKIKSVVNEVELSRLLFEG